MVKKRIKEHDTICPDLLRRGLSATRKIVLAKNRRKRKKNRLKSWEAGISERHGGLKQSDSGTETIEQQQEGRRRIPRGCHQRNELAERAHLAE